MVATRVKRSRWRHKVETWLGELGFVTTVRGLGFPGDDIVAVIPGARFVPVPDTTHYIQAERPDVVIAAAQAAAANRTLTITPSAPTAPATP